MKLASFGIVIRSFVGHGIGRKLHEDPQVPNFGEPGKGLIRHEARAPLVTAAAHGGWAGVVIDGCVRDTAELALCPIGIRALAPMPLPTEKRNEGQKDVPVLIQGVWVRPGDWLYADEDGIVVADRKLGLRLGDSYVG